MEASAASTPYFRHLQSGRSYEGQRVKEDGEVILAGVHDEAGELVKAVLGDWILTGTERGEQRKVTQAELAAGYGPMNAAARAALVSEK